MDRVEAPARRSWTEEVELQEKGLSFGVKATPRKHSDVVKGVSESVPVKRVENGELGQGLKFEYQCCRDEVLARYWEFKTLGRLAGKVGFPIRTDSMTAAKARILYARVLVDIDTSKDLVEDRLTDCYSTQLKDEMHEQQRELAHVVKAEVDLLKQQARATWYTNNLLGCANPVGERLKEEVVNFGPCLSTEMRGNLEAGFTAAESNIIGIFVITGSDLKTLKILQHKSISVLRYCSNYYGESSDRFTDVCDWCQSEERRRTTLKQGGGSSKSKGMATSSSPRSAEKIKQQHRDKGEDSGSGGGSSGEKAGRNSGGSGGGGVPSPRTGARRVFGLGLRWTKRVHEMDNYS
ncbi:hypothetical protein AKJ16_DCAP19787 [Drosera capensis]